MNTNRSSTVTVSRRESSRWMMRKLLYWQPKGNSYSCKVGSKNKRITWSEYPGRLTRNNNIVWKFYKHGSRLTRNWMQHTPNRSKPSRRCRFWWPNKPQKTRRLSIRALQESSHFHQVPTQTKTHNRPSSQCSNLFSRCKTWGATALRNSSWQLVRQMRKLRKSVRSWHKQCGNGRVGVLSQNQGSKLSNLRVMWQYWTHSSLRAHLVSAAWTSKAKKPSRGVCRTQPQKRDVWQRSASKKKMSKNLICLWFWIRFIAVPFDLSLSRVGGTENPGPVCVTAKLFGAKYDAIRKRAQNLSSKSVVELEPLFAQVGECRQLFSERFRKDSKPYTSSVRQDIHSTHSHPDRSSMLALPVHVGDPAHTQQFCDYLSLFQEGEQSGSDQHVLSNLHFRRMEGQERSNPFCHRTTRGGRKHTGKRRRLELSKGVVNILQCNVTTWSKHARHYILTSDFDATLISETHLRRDGLLSPVTEAKKSGWAGTDSEATNTVINGTSAGVLTLVRKRWFFQAPVNFQ